MAFHGWPGMRAPAGGVEATELAQDHGRAVTRYAADRVAAVSTLPAVPVASKTRTTKHSATRRHAKAHRTPTTGSGHAPAGTEAPKPTSGEGSADAAPAAPAASGADAPSSSGSSAPSPSTPATPSKPSTPSTPTTPTTPTPPTAPLTDGAAQAVEGTTQAVGGAVNNVTSAAAGALQPVSPPVANTVGAAGQAIDQTVTGVGQVVGGILGGLGGHHQP